MKARCKQVVSEKGMVTKTPNRTITELISHNKSQYSLAFDMVIEAVIKRGLKTEVAESLEVLIKHFCC